VPARSTGFGFGFVVFNKEKAMGFVETFLMVILGGMIEREWRFIERTTEGVTGQDWGREGIAAEDQPLW
jgi:hypothetical protein